MTSTKPAVVTLETVRARFLEAESSLQEIAAGLSQVQSASQRFDAAAGVITQARERLIRVADELGVGTQAIARSLELVRNGIGALEKTDPGKLLAELNRLGGTITTHAKQVDDGLSRLGSQLSQTHERGLNATGEQHAEVLKGIEQAVATLRRDVERGVASGTSQVERSISALDDRIVERSNAGIAGLQEQMQAAHAGVLERVDVTVAHGQRLSSDIARLQSEVGRLGSETRASATRLTWLVSGVTILLLAVELWAAFR